MSWRLPKTGLLLGVCLALTSCAVFNPPKPGLPSRESIIPGARITVQKNQNVYAIARQNNVSMRDLIVLNNIQSPYNIKAGQQLILPAGGGSVSTEASSATTMPPPSASAVSMVEQSALPPIQTAELPPPVMKAKPTQEERAEALTTPAPVKNVATTAAHEVARQESVSQPVAKPPEDAPNMSFVWPVQGPVLSAYGSKGQGLNNDGVNIGAPKGAPVVAAASGIVVYSGNEMKGFGNLVLIRHQGGWVTAYAHLDRTLVTKDAVVAQGDMIGTVGKTGSVNAPQLHFETRYQGKAVDPNGTIKG